jgi:hypothetical protein
MTGLSRTHELLPLACFIDSASMPTHVPRRQDPRIARPSAPRLLHSDRHSFTPSVRPQPAASKQASPCLFYLRTKQGKTHAQGQARQGKPSFIQARHSSLPSPIMTHLSTQRPPPSPYQRGRPAFAPASFYRGLCVGVWGFVGGLGLRGQDKTSSKTGRSRVAEEFKNACCRELLLPQL